MKIFYFTGVDGSGKTTLAKGLVRQSQDQDEELAYFYAQHKPLLMLPVKWLARRTMLANANPEVNYKYYSKKKTTASIRHPLMAKLYALIWLLDYFMLTYLRLLPSLFRGSTMIIDRYYLDIVVNISQTLGLSSKEMKALAIQVRRFFPNPAAIFFINLPEEIAFARKDDISSVEYLRERRERYEQLGQDFNFIALDGTQPPESLREEAMIKLNDCMRNPARVEQR